MLAAEHKNLTASLFEAILTRKSQNLGADLFAFIIVSPNSMKSEIFLNKDLKIDKGIIDDVKKKSPEIWLIGKREGFKTCCEYLDDAGGDTICKYIMKKFACQTLLMSPFELEEIGGGILLWAWKNKLPDETGIYLEKSKLIAEQIKLSLKLALKEQRDQEISAKLAALLELSTAIYSSLNYTDVLEKAIHLSKKIIGADGGSIFILDKKDNLLRPLITIDETHEDQISRVTLRPGEGLTGLVVQTGVGLISNHSEDDPRTFQVPDTPIEPESLICAPLTWSGEVIGAITLRSTAGKPFSQEDLEILTIVARQTADAIENAKLYESLENAYKELTNTQEQLVMTEKLRALGEMAGGVAHDFNNVLGTILGRTQLLLREMRDTRWLEYLKQIEQVTLAGAKTVQKLQNFTRISSRGQFENIDLRHIIADAIETTKPRWKDDCQRQGISIELNSEIKELYPILGNRSELIEAVSNLILNAVDALPKGGRINISAYMDKMRAAIKVEDNGIGMADATLNRVFYPFFTTKGIKNTGMGLAVVYGIVTRHKGEVDVSSKLGEGTTCILYFPTAAKTEPKAIEAIETEQEIQAKILFIDDDENIRDVMRDMLEFLNHEVVLATSGEEGVELFKKGDFDMVMTDLGMSGISGWEVVKICKSIRSHIPVIMVSGWGNQIDDEMVGQSYLDGIMAKPFEINKIKNLIQEVLANRPDKSVDASVGNS